MKYFSIDTETTGLDANKCQLLELAVVYDNGDLNTPPEDLPYFHAVFSWDIVVGNPYAVGMNAELLQKGRKGARQYKIEVADDMDQMFKFHNKRFPLPNKIANACEEDFLKWLCEVKEVEPKGIKRSTFAGKNVAAFDFNFVPWIRKYAIHRTMDPAMLYTKWTDDRPAGLAKCKERAGLGDSVAHTALEDALDVVRLIRLGIGS